MYLCFRLFFTRDFYNQIIKLERPKTNQNPKAVVLYFQNIQFPVRCTIMGAARLDQRQRFDLDYKFS